MFDPMIPLFSSSLSLSLGSLTLGYDLRTFCTPLLDWNLNDRFLGIQLGFRFNLRIWEWGKWKGKVTLEITSEL